MPRAYVRSPASISLSMTLKRTLVLEQPSDEAVEIRIEAVDEIAVRRGAERAERRRLAERASCRRPAPRSPMPSTFIASGSDQVVRS